MDLEDHEGNFLDEESFSEYHLAAIDSHDFMEENRSDSMNYLNRVDYSLNSPMIVDEMREFVKYCKGQPYDPRWNMKVWNLRKIGFNNPQELNSPDTFHSWFGKYNVSINPSLDRITKLLVSTDKDAQSTYPVVSAFFKGWLNKNIQNPKNHNVDPKIKSWGALFLETHFITLLMNANTITEIENMNGLLTIKKIPDSIRGSIIYVSPVFGEVYICLGYVYIPKFKRIFDRTTILMMKDVYNSRFHSLLSMTQRVDNKYQLDDWKNLNKLYTMGDVMLGYAGNQAYKCIKILEPLCNNQLMIKAHKYRPLIKYYNNFQGHLDNTVNELRMICPNISTFVNHINQAGSVELTLTYFGSFRHWGHPYVNSLIGVKKLHDRVNKEIKVDDKYAGQLASDLARKVLESKFKEKSKWFVLKDELEKDHPFYNHIQLGTWPTPKQIKDFGDKWHLLPLEKCFDIPDLIDPSNIYSDKSHSMNRSQVISYINKRSPGSIPTKKVLETMINSPATDWKEFLERIDKRGLDWEELIIGLKEKERELKEDGRFYCLMSWALREYFVVTEYLIKLHFIPLFKGLTVADDMTTLIKKMMDNSSGQGLDDYSRVSYANHLDYEKWNNYQRIESNGPTFRVMGQFLGYPNLIYRTHEFFQKSVIYYTQRPDLMMVKDNKIINKTENVVVWEGQLGGFEGIRQKGWSILNALSVERESRNLNTRVTLLAQGDNQIICSNYKLQPSRDLAELNINLERIKSNNDSIMAGIDKGVSKLGLKINKDETMQSADFLSYGKVPIFRGNIRPLEEKRWSRCSCVTNDQLPTLGNVISSVSSNALTISHFSPSPINTIIHYNFVGNLIRNLLDLHNPATRDSIKSIKNSDIPDAHVSYCIKAIYLDPCIGGVSGMSLTRFLIRMFPDPVSESLSFWKLIYHNIQKEYQPLISSMGYCRIATLTSDNFTKLLENPLSLNLKNTISPVSKIKEVIRESLYQKGNTIENLMIRDAILYSKKHFDEVNMFLMSIDPLFPRFLSEFRSSTYLGITESMIGLFENSKTIRNIFHKNMMANIDKIIVSSEIQSLTSMHSLEWSKYKKLMWDCSASRADHLRLESWGRKVIGATVPHPIEMLHCLEFKGINCKVCDSVDKERGHLITLLPDGLYKYLDSRGKYMAYLGSRTSETTSIIQPWERESKIPLIKRAAKLRNVIHWFVEPNTNLALSIFSICKGLTGEEWDSGTVGFKRTGCGPHRYASSRQSAGGYSAQSPAKLTRMTTTTDTMGSINEDNYDFMYQSSILFSQITVGELHDNRFNSGIYHTHINCEKCLRKIENPTLDSKSIFIHPNVSDKLSKWKPESSPWAETKITVDLKLGDWDSLDDVVKSYHIGRVQGFIFGDSLISKSNIVESTALFPLGLASKVSPKEFLEGLLDGLIRIGSIYALSRRSVMELKKPRATLLGIVLYLIESLSLDPSLINIWRNKNFIQEFSNQPHKIPSSYPLSNFDLGSLGRYYLKLLFKKVCIINDQYQSTHKTLWIFSDVNDFRLVGSMMLSKKIAYLLYNKALKSSDIDKLRGLKDSLNYYREQSKIQPLTLLESDPHILRVDREVRHAAKEMEPKVDLRDHSEIDWTEEEYADIHRHKVNYTSQRETRPQHSVPRIQDPLISGLRAFQCATGAHYKLRSIIIKLGIRYNDVICGGDGSGGVGSWILRHNKSSRLIFNSLLNVEGVYLRGSSPSGPSAIELIPEISRRCVNLTESWKNPNDLTLPATWDYFKFIKEKNNMNIDLLIFDMEINNIEQYNRVVSLMETKMGDLITKNGNLIVKTYWNILYGKEVSVLEQIGIYFKKVDIIWTDYTSSHSSEIYIVMRCYTDRNINLYPSYIGIEDFMRSSPCYRDDEQEFSRAIKLKLKNHLRGVPHRYHQDPFVHLSTLLMTLGVSTGVAAVLGESVKYPSSLTNPINTAFVIYLVSINNILGITHGTKGEITVPSDASIWNVGILTIGFAYWLCLSRERLALYKWCLHVLKYQFPFSWCNISKRSFHQKRYSFLKKYPSSKNFHFDKELAKIGQVIRIFIRLFNTEIGQLDTKILDRDLEAFDQHLSCRKITQLTDIFELIDSPETVMCDESVSNRVILEDYVVESSYVN